MDDFLSGALMVAGILAAIGLILLIVGNIVDLLGEEGNDDE